METNKIEGNKAIIKFMGLKPIKHDGRFYLSKDHCSCGEDTEEATIAGFASIAKYSTSRDWLMEVVEEIGILPNDIYPDGLFKYLVDVEINIGSRSIEIYGVYKRLGDNSIPCICKYENALFENIWDAVVEFCNWYNNR